VNPALAPILTDPEVTKAKFERELLEFRANSAAARNAVLLGVNHEVPFVELAFISKVTMSSGSVPLPVVVACIRLTYDNYDLWPPSLLFIDMFTKEPVLPHTRAFLPTPDGPRDVLVNSHPKTNLPFLCLPGIREYHSHPQHSGDNWLLHRPAKEGSLSVTADRVWRTMSANVLGVGFSLQTLPVFPLRAKVTIQMLQGDLQLSETQIEKLTASSQ
jgi:hypothetical protein